jgi:hypothetical protein
LETAIIVAIITALGVITAAIVNSRKQSSNKLETKASEQLSQTPIKPKNSARFDMLIGSYEGKVFQEMQDDIYVDHCNLHLRAGTNNQIEGELDIHFNRQGILSASNHRMLVAGAYHHESILTLYYKNEKEANVQAGTITLTQSTLGTELFGEYAGYGPISGKLVNGTINFKKI